MADDRAAMSGEEIALLQRLAMGETLHGDDPLIATLEAMGARGLGQLRYHHGWYFEAYPPACVATEKWA
jgi:hypothetical protein